MMERSQGVCSLRSSLQERFYGFFFVSWYDSGEDSALVRSR